MSRLSTPAMDTRFGLKAMIANSLMRSICRANSPVISLMHSMRLSVRKRGEMCAPSRRATPTPMCFSCRDASSRKTPLSEISAYKAAETLYSQAVVVDPGFALAHARVAITLGLLYRFRGPSEELKARARAEAREALRLQSDLGEAHLAQGLYHYRVERDFDRALPELEIARRLLPNDTEAEITIAFIHRRQGRWREARAGQSVLFPVIRTIKSMSKNCTLLPASSAIGLPQPNMLIVPWLSRRKWVR